MTQVLTIAGSDPGGGAGIQADLKAIHASGAFGLSVLTAVTAQNTRAVTAVFELPAEIIAAQLDAVFDDFEVAAVKTGMLSSGPVVELVAATLAARGARNVVVDPVMVSTSGRTLLQPEAIDSVKQGLFPLAALVTPNVPEAERLAGMEIAGVADAEEAARRIHALGPAAVLVKGGHLRAAPAMDVLYDDRGLYHFEGEFIATPYPHGAGCTYSAAIAAHLACGRGLRDAIAAAKAYVTETIRHTLPIGHGRGPTDHFYFMRGER